LIDNMDNDGAIMHAQIPVVLYSGRGRMNINKQKFTQKIAELACIPGVSYDPYSTSIYVKDVVRGTSEVNNMERSLVRMFSTIAYAIQKNKLIQDDGSHTPDCASLMRLSMIPGSRTSDSL
jgi:hypothetical protein